MEVFALLCSLFLLHPNNKKSVRLLIIIMLVSVVAESVALYFHHVLKAANNHLPYNISVPLIVILLLLLIHQNLKNPVHKAYIRFSIPVYIVLCVCNFLFLQEIRKFATYNYITGAIFLALACAYYFLEFIKTPVSTSVAADPVFWVCVGVLVLYVPKCILYALFEYLAYKKSASDIFGITYHLINNILIVIFFCCLSYASICRLIFRKSIRG